MDLGTVLRAARVDAGLTQRAVAAALGVTPHTVSRWESGERSVRSNDADRVLAVCGRDVRFTVVDRMADVSDALTALAAQSLMGRLLSCEVLSADPLEQLQAAGATFTGAWAAAAVGLPALHRCGGFRLSADPVQQAAAAAVLRPLSVHRLAPGGPWSVIWNDEAFVRNPRGRYYSGVIGEFTAEVHTEPYAEVRVGTDLGPWRVVPPAELVPDIVDQRALDVWAATT